MSEFFHHIAQEFDLPLVNPVLIFSLILLIILLSPLLLKRLNIPGIIGLIISGVIIGPHGLNILEKTSAIELFSTIGLLYIMFIAGLELDMNDFKANRNKSLLFGFFTFIIPLVVGFPVCYYLLGYDFNASFLTASMFSTHTLVAYPIVSKLGVSKNQSVAISVGGTILTDTAVLIILAVVLSNSQGSLNQDFWIKLTLSLTVFTAIIFLVIPRIARWFFRILESEKHSHYIFVLAVVFFAAFLAELAGVEPIIGAFMAGLALNRLIPHSSALMNRIEFIGNSLFIPFFLISVGMIVDVSVILSGPGALLVAGTLTLVALLGKWLAAFATQWTFGYSSAQRQLIFGLSSSHAAATLAIILVGYQYGILDENILNGTIILILITCVVASFVTERAAKRIKLEVTEDVDEAAVSGGLANEHILLPIANTQNMEKLLEFSIYIRDKKSLNPVSILSVVSDNSEAEVNILKARAKLEEFVKQASAFETLVNVITTIDYNPASGISRISKETMVDIIVLGWPKRSGLLDKLIGDKVDSIVSNTDKCTFIVHLEHPLNLHTRVVIVVPPLAERESGFEQWATKLAKLAKELSIPIIVYCNEATGTALEKLDERSKFSATYTVQPFSRWSSVMVLTRNIRPNDIFVLVTARKGSASYMSDLDNIPSKLEKQLSATSRLVIYPQQYENFHMNERYDVTGETINRGLETVQKLGKGLSNILRKK